MKKILSIIVIITVLFNLTGCEAVRKKFTRKKKIVKAPRIYQVKKYEKKPTPELYKKHYAYWASWQSEIIKVLGQNHKKDMRCIEEILGNLKDMQNILVKEKADELEPRIDALTKVREMIFNEDLTSIRVDMIKRKLEHEERLIKREFAYDKVKDHLKANFEDEG